MHAHAYNVVLQVTINGIDSFAIFSFYCDEKRKKEKGKKGKKRNKKEEKRNQQ